MTQPQPLTQINHYRCPRKQIAEIGKKNLPLPFYTIIQAGFTWLVGKPYRGQVPLFRSTNEWELFKATAALCGGVFSGCWIFNSLPIWFYPLLFAPCLITAGAARKFLVSICHRCIHKQFWGDYRDRILAEIVSTVLLLSGFDSYYHEHIRLHHHFKVFATKDDPDAKLLLSIGFLPGLKDL
jgi:fatty acid desaturase